MRNKSVNVSNLSLTRVDGNNVEQDGKLNTYDLARLSFDWSGVDANLKSGDSFTIGLGEYFTNLQNNETHPMTVEPRRQGRRGRHLHPDCQGRHLHLQLQG